MTVDDIIAALPEEQQAEARATLDGLNPLSGVSDADSAVELIKSNEALRRGYDKIAQQAVEAHKAKFEADKLPELKKQWRDEVRKELQPEETPEQRRLRELEEQLSERDKKERLYQTRDKLRSKAKELGFDEGLAERFAYMQTDDPEAELSTFAEKMQAAVKSMAEKEVEARWPTKAPRNGTTGGGKITNADQVPSDWTPQDYARAVEAGTVELQG